MTTFAESANRGALIDQLIPRSLAVNVVLVAGGAALTGLLAQVAIPLWPVPITGQTLAVLLVASSLGAWRGSLSMVVYALLGTAGVPWFSGAASGVGVIGGPTGGYILGFVVAAWVVGKLSEHRWSSRFWQALVTFLAGTVIIFALGLIWLSIALQLNLEQTLTAGLYPFVIGGVVKAAIAAALIPSAWKLAERLRIRRGSEDGHGTP